jgi:hypothetical protein
MVEGNCDRVPPGGAFKRKIIEQRDDHDIHHKPTHDHVSMLVTRVLGEEPVLVLGPNEEGVLHTGHLLHGEEAIGH